MPGETKVRYPDSRNDRSIQDGLEFQDLVTDRLAQDGIIIQNYCSKAYQLQKGENRQGWEIKLDNRCTETGRLSIEVAERTALDRPWVPSGIYAGHSAFYIHGNRERFWLFETSFLQRLHKTARYAEKDDNPPTIRTFYLPISDADKYGLRFEVEHPDGVPF